MASAGQQFVADLEAMVLNARGRMEALARQTVQVTCQDVIMNTPVLTGFMRGSWQPSINAPAQGHAVTPPSEDTIDADKLADRGVVQLSLMISQFKLGQVFYLTNNAKYAARIEYGFTGRDRRGREVHQTGRFFVRKILQRWQDTVRRVAGELRMNTR